MKHQDQPDSRKASGFKFNRIRKTFSQVNPHKKRSTGFPGFLNDSQGKISTCRYNSICSDGPVWNPGNPVDLAPGCLNTWPELRKQASARIPDSRKANPGIPGA